MSKLKLCDLEKAMLAQMQAIEDRAADTLWIGSPLVKGMSVYLKEYLARRPEPSDPIADTANKLAARMGAEFVPVDRSEVEAATIDCPRAYAAGEKTYRNLMAIQERTGHVFTPEYIAMAVVQDALREAIRSLTGGVE